jgi:squalene cyclase
MIASSLVDTTAVLDTFYYLGETDESYTKGIDWLGTQTVTSCSLLTKQIKTLAESGTDTSSLVETLVSYQRDDGAFGGYGMGNLNTALVLSAFKAANYSETTVIGKAISYLQANQNDDGGFGIAGKLSLADDSAKESRVYMTALAILTLSQYSSDFYVKPAIDNARQWLANQQNENGSFGENGGTIYQRALAYLALVSEQLAVSSEQIREVRRRAIEYIRDKQLEDGSWNDDAYSTALALRALKDSAPDLAISSEDVGFTPQVPIEGEPVTITATVHNRGGRQVEKVKVVISDQSSVIGEETIQTIPVGGSEAVEFTWIAESGTHEFEIVVDPENLISETSEDNNSITSS